MTCRACDLSSTTTMLAVTIVVVLASTTLVGAFVPSVPGPWDNLYATWTSLDISEGLAVDCSYYLNVTANAGMLNCSNTQGWYALQLNTDIYNIMYEIDGQLVCYSTEAYYEQVYPYSLWQGFEFIRNTSFMHREVSEFRVVVNRFYAPLFVDRATNVPLLFANGIRNNVRRLVMEWKPNSVPASSPALALRSQCNLDKADRQSARREFLTVERELVEMFGVRLPAIDYEAVGKDLYARLPPRHTDVSDLVALASMGLPASVDNTPYATAVRNQGRCGGCWAFATTALTEVIANKAKGALSNHTTKEWLSPQSKLDCVHGNSNGTALYHAKGCSGGWPISALEDTVINGIATEATYPYAFTTGRRCLRNDPGVVTVHPLSSAFVIEMGNVTMMMAAVAQYGGVAAAINPINSFDWFGGNGVFNDPNCSPGVDHIIMILGYGTDPIAGDYWIIKNSFGAAWSAAGYMRMARGVNMCGIENYAFGARPADPSSL